MECNHISEVYFDVDSASKRYQQVFDKFESSFPGGKPDFVTRSPGRVNIIGDHVDYSYFPCLPAALSYDVIMAVQVVKKGEPGEDIVKLVNVDSKYPDYVFPADPSVTIDSKTWGNYFKCSWITSLKYLGIKNRNNVHGLRVVISGNVPAGGGLSSSAAFVVTGCVTTLQSHTPRGQFPLDKQALTALSATCEQLVGVNSGGLDQAASVYGQKDHALLVSFRPELSVRTLEFPPSDDPAVFLIANSLVVSEKLLTAPIHYNLRVVEVTIAANILAHKMGNLEIPQDGNLDAGTLHGVLMSKYGKVDKESLARMADNVKKYLKEEPYTIEEVAEVLGSSVDDVKDKYMKMFPVRFERLKLWQRALHVYEETLRVLEYVDAMEANSDYTELGDLMNASQRSAEDLYENSHPDCEELCRIARKAGALGSRVTGAGWGGATVHLVRRSQSDTVRAALKREYYDIKYPAAPVDAVVESRPGRGTVLYLQPEQILR